MTDTKDKPKRPELPHPHHRNAHWRTIQFVLQNFFGFWLNYRAKGLENLPEEGALLLVNHQSYLDPLLVGLPLQRPVSFLARDSLFPIPIIGWILRNTYVMPVNRESASTGSVRECVRRIQHGYLVGLFPEGTRTLDGSIGEIKPGFVAIAKRAKAPVIPVGIAGAYEAFPRGAWFVRPKKVRVCYGEPISAEEVERLSQRGNEQEFCDLVQSRLRNCAEHAERWRRDAAVGYDPPPSPNTTDPATTTQPAD